MSIQDLIAQRGMAQTNPQGQMTDRTVAYQQKVKEDMLAGKPVKMINGTIVPADAQNMDMGPDIPRERLYVSQWYETDKALLEGETKVMSFHFPNFQLVQLPDKRLAWQGVIAPNLATGRKWEILAVYNHNHPAQDIGSSVKVFLVNPTLDEVCQRLGFTPHHLFRSEQDGLYLCTIDSTSVQTGTRVTSAANNLLRAAKWLICAEFVMLGVMSRAEFDSPVGI